jgi:hypothetical protein
MLRANAEFCVNIYRNRSNNTKSGANKTVTLNEHCRSPNCATGSNETVESRRLINKRATSLFCVRAIWSKLSHRTDRIGKRSRPGVNVREIMSNNTKLELPINKHYRRVVAIVQSELP